MAEPLRLRIVKALTALIETVEPDSNSGDTGPTYTLAGKVFRGRNLFGEGDPIPMVSILEAPIAEDQLQSPPESPLTTGDWELLIQGFVKDDKDNPTDNAYLLAADVVSVLAGEKKRLATVRSTNGVPGALFGIYRADGRTPAIVGLKIGAPVCRPPDEVSSKAYFWLRISITLAENLADPWA